ncbi:MAG: FAD/NAD(P)-binding protein [Verrucomicrobia bacterium]|nr:FAD/NAD(P)-binding protein [Verrucomicrobiota bacterium]
MMISARKDIFLPDPATVVEVRKMTASEKFFSFKLDGKSDMRFEPGQFFEISVPGIGEAPISVTSSPEEVAPGEFHMVIRKVGNVTGALHAMDAGSKVGVRGPFGTSFPVDTEMKGKDLLFVCGGIGLVPVRSAIKHVLAHREDYGRITILSGTRSPAERLFMEDLAEWTERDDVEFIETVDVADDHWSGNVGVITTLFSMITLDVGNTSVIICGPPIMYKFVLLELDKMNFADEQIFMSLERHMKCGVGKCGHCQINGIYACQDGPVVKYADIRDLKEAI